MVKVAILCGSLRKEAISKKIGRAVRNMFPPGYEAEIVEIGNLPLYNQDFDDENRPPEEYIQFRRKIQEMDAVLFITPEYNRSIPAVLKNALDVGSRPYGKSVWNGKPAAIISHSPGNLSGFGANHHLRQCLVFLNMPVIQQPEVYLAGSHQLLDEKDDWKNEETKTFIQSFIDAFVDLIEKYRG
jgi:NADPH-dependent FMN reductase.